MPQIVAADANAGHDLEQRKGYNGMKHLSEDNGFAIPLLGLVVVNSQVLYLQLDIELSQERVLAQRQLDKNKAKSWFNPSNISARCVNMPSMTRTY